MRFNYQGVDWIVECDALGDYTGGEVFDAWLVNPADENDVIHIDELPEEIRYQLLEQLYDNQTNDDNEYFFDDGFSENGDF